MYGIFTYIWLIFMVNVGKYTSPMDCMGYLSHVISADPPVDSRSATLESQRLRRYFDDGEVLKLPGGDQKTHHKKWLIFDDLQYISGWTNCIYIYIYTPLKFNIPIGSM